MSVRIMSMVFEHSRATLADRLVLLAIADNADHHGVAWPGLELIAEKAHVSVRTAQRCIRSLESLGELRVELQTGPWTVNTYHVLCGRGDKLSPHGDGGGDNRVTGGVTNTAQGGDNRVTGGVTTVSPKPSVNRHEPSGESETRARADRPTAAAGGAAEGRNANTDAGEPDPLTPSELIARWNIIPGVLPVHEERLQPGVGLLKRLASRLREHPDESWWTAFFSEIEASDWLRGRKACGSGDVFQASFSWSLLPENMAKILEGNYRAPPARAVPVAGRRTAMSTLLEEIHDGVRVQAGVGAVGGSAIRA